MRAIEIQGLTKKYRDMYALQDVSLSVEKGEIYGIVGKNGAGKTTMMKCILGLIPDYGGNVKIMESSQLKTMRKKVGALLEDPGFFPYMTGYENLKYYATSMGLNHEKQHIEELLAMVQLETAKNKKTGKYSMGMKQRLGLALACMGDPEILVLDEPINGIDPEGIVEIRNLFLDLAKKKGKTILISSHILSELENVCDRFCILNEGKLVEEVDAKVNTKKVESIITLITDNNAKALEILREAGLDARGEEKISIYGDVSTALVTKTFMDTEIEILEISKTKESLEDYYLHAIKGGTSC
ncbi:MAG: ATP-binding cassette domain-containing protein [Tissierellia bacterium]|nr:ATP-binding cassette domain-containing protein [Tissierellia bacterium]